MILGRYPTQHCEVGWVRAEGWAVLVPDGKLYRQLGPSANKEQCEQTAAKYPGARVVEFHTEEWAGLLDGSWLHTM